MPFHWDVFLLIFLTPLVVSDSQISILTCAPREDLEDTQEENSEKDFSLKACARYRDERNSPVIWSIRLAWVRRLFEVDQDSWVV